MTEARAMHAGYAAVRVFVHKPVVGNCALKMKRRPGLARPASEEEKVMMHHHKFLPKTVVIPRIRAKVTIGQS
jgi:hypothetical protein